MAGVGRHCVWLRCKTIVVWRPQDLSVVIRSVGEMNMNKLMHYKLVLAAGVLAPFLFLFSLSIFADNPQPIKFRGVNALGEEIFLMHHGREENRERKSWSVYVGTRPGEYQMTKGNNAS